MINTFYLFKPGKLNVKDNNILYVNEKNETINIPIKQISDLYLSIDIISTSNIIKLIMNEGIIIHYFNSYEYYIGSLIPKNHKNSGKIIIKEVLAYNDKEKRLGIAREIMYGSIKNITSVIKYYERRSVLISNLETEETINKIKQAKNINHLMLIEAEFRKKYYKHFIKILNFDTYNRIGKGATDLINSLINFINSLLYSIIFSEIKKTNISGMIGFIHEVDHNRYPLIYDISELFKPIMVDRLIFSLLNKKQLTINHVKNGRLNNEAIKIIFLEWDKTLNKTFYYKPLKRYVTFRNLIREELYKLERFLSKGTDYKSFKQWW